MSQVEFHKGILRKLDLDGLTLEGWAHRTLSEAGYGEEYFEDCESFLSLLKDEMGNEYVIVGQEVYKVEKIVSDRDGSYTFCELKDNGDGTIDYITQFYNGGTSLDEMIENSLKKITNDSSKGKS